MSEVMLTSEVKPIIQPKVVYEEALNTAPYTIKVNAGFLGQLLLDQGWSDKDVAGLEVLVRRGGDHAVDLGKYDSKKHQVRFNTQWIWNHYRKATELAQKVSQGEASPNKSQFKDLLTTKRLSGYLSTAPAERGLAFANRLFLQAVERELNNWTLHEVGHADDEHNPSKNYSDLKRQEIMSAIRVFGSTLLLGLTSVELIERYSQAPDPQKTIATSLISLAIAIKAFTAVRKLSPSERSADKFAYLYSKEASIHSLVSISPKQS